MKKAEIINIGDEILIGQIINHNAAYIGKTITAAGFYPEWMSVVRDEPESIVESFRNALARADLVIVTGGLGPTHDDITKQTAAEYFKCELILDPDLEKHVRQIYASRGREVPDSATNQFLAPKGARLIPNPIGTAAGIIFQTDEKTMILLPGVPYEMKRMMDESVLPFLKSLDVPGSIRFMTVHTTGIPESLLFEKIDNLNDILRMVKVAFLPRNTGVDIRLSAFEDTADNVRKNLEEALEMLRRKINPHITGYDDESLEETILNLLIKQRKTIAVAESCTGGLISSRITDVSGASAVFLRGIVAYSNQAKVHVLNVPEDLLAQHGAVSAEVAQAMAEGVRCSSNSDIGIATTGIAGPDGATETKPVGLVYIALAASGYVSVERHVFTSDRLTNKMRFSQSALELVRKYLVSI